MQSLGSIDLPTALNRFLFECFIIFSQNNYDPNRMIICTMWKFVFTIYYQMGLHMHTLRWWFRASSEMKIQAQMWAQCANLDFGGRNLYFSLHKYTKYCAIKSASTMNGNTLNHFLFLISISKRVWVDEKTTINGIKIWDQNEQMDINALNTERKREPV